MNGGEFVFVVCSSYEQVCSYLQGDFAVCPSLELCESNHTDANYLLSDAFEMIKKNGIVISGIPRRYFRVNRIFYSQEDYVLMLISSRVIPIKLDATYTDLYAIVAEELDMVSGTLELLTGTGSDVLPETNEVKVRTRFERGKVHQLHARTKALPSTPKSQPTPPTIAGPPIKSLRSLGIDSLRNYSQTKAYMTRSTTLVSRASAFPSQGVVGGIAVSLFAAGTIGLINMGNTCFLNAGVQCLAHLPPIKKLAFGDHEHHSSPLVSEWTSLVRQLWTEGSRAVMPTHFKVWRICAFVKCVLSDEMRKAEIDKLKLFQLNQQHDSAEFVLALLDRLNEETRKKEMHLLEVKILMYRCIWF